MAVGITQAGLGQPIFIYDDASSALGTGYRFSEISAAFPLDFVDLGTNKPSYRAKVDLQVGDVGAGTATTSLIDTDGSSVIWDNGKTLKNRLSQFTSWVYTFGTKVGSGNQASGVKGSRLTFGAATSLTGAISCYGSTFHQTVGAMSMQPAITSTGDIINSLFQSVATGTAPINLGNAASRFANIYNVDISHTTSVQVQTNFCADVAERITIGCAAPTAFLSSGANAINFKDLAMFGSPTISDLRWNAVGALDWKLYRPQWTGNANKFSTGAANFPALNGATIEYRLWNLKVVDRTGLGIAGIYFTLTDATGSVPLSGNVASDGTFNAVTGEIGRMIPVMDHYISSGTTYAQRSRSPFTLRVNTPELPVYYPNYQSRVVVFYWAGSETMALNSGQFADMYDVVPLEDAPGNPTTWVEVAVP